MLRRRGGGERAERERFFARARGHTPLLAASTAQGTFLVATEDGHIGRALFSKGHYGDKQILLAGRIVRELTRPTGPVFVDVGAHVGTSTALALGDCGFERALAFEPEPGNYRLLRANLELNGLSDRVDARPQAVSDRPGRVLLAVEPGRSGEHHLVHSDSSARHPGAEQVEVEAVVLDDLVGAGELDPAEVGLLKVDVEGHEAAVLAGASRLVEAGVPATIEFAPELLRAAGGLDDLLALIADGFSHVHDVRGGIKRAQALEGGMLPDALPAGRIAELAVRYADHFTDLVLVRR